METTKHRARFSEYFCGHEQIFNLAKLTIKSISKHLGKHGFLWRDKNRIKICDTEIARFVTVDKITPFWTWCYVGPHGFNWNCFIWLRELSKYRCGSRFTSIGSTGADGFGMLKASSNIPIGICSPMSTVEPMYGFLVWSLCRIQVSAATVTLCSCDLLCVEWPFNLGWINRFEVSGVGRWTFAQLGRFGGIGSKALWMVSKVYPVCTCTGEILPGVLEFQTVWYTKKNSCRISCIFHSPCDLFSNLNESKNLPNNHSIEDGTRWECMM